MGLIARRLAPLIGGVIGCGLFVAPSWVLAQRALLPSQAASETAAPDPTTGASGVTGRSMPKSNAISPALEGLIERTITAHGSFVSRRVEVQVGKPRQALPKCSEDMEVSLSSDSRPWGSISVQVSCRAPQWSRPVPVMTRVYGDQLVSAHSLKVGSRIEPKDLLVQSAVELTKSPADLLDHPTQAVGKQLTKPLTAGTPIRLNHLREIAVVQVGGGVLVQVIGKGFQAGGEGVALTAGGIGETIRVKMPDGQQVSAKVVRPGVVELNVP